MAWSTAGTPVNAWVAMAWQFQYALASGRWLMAQASMRLPWNRSDDWPRSAPLGLVASTAPTPGSPDGPDAGCSAARESP